MLLSNRSSAVVDRQIIKEHILAALIAQVYIKISISADYEIGGTEHLLPLHGAADQRDLCSSGMIRTVDTIKFFIHDHPVQIRFGTGIVVGLSAQETGKISTGTAVDAGGGDGASVRAAVSDNASEKQRK